MASSDSEEVDEDSSLASTEHVFKIWHVWRANFFVFECLCDANHHLQNGRHHPRIGNGPRNHTSSKRRDCSGRRFVASFRRHIFNTTHQFETRHCQSCQINCTTPHPTRAHLKKKVRWARTVDTNPPFKSPSAFLPSASVLAPFEEPGDIDNHPGPPSAGHDMREGWREMTNRKICPLEKMNNTQRCTCCSAGILLV